MLRARPPAEYLDFFYKKKKLLFWNYFYRIKKLQEKLMFLQLKIRTREQLIPRFLPQTRWNPKQWFHHTADVYALHCCVKCKFYNPPSMYLRKNKWWAINARTFSDCSIVSCYCCETYESVFCSETPPVLLMKCKLLIQLLFPNTGQGQGQASIQVIVP